jgi:8-oxo-dGTP pyrophosphatase MutT (NUDIX family)
MKMIYNYLVYITSGKIKMEIKRISRRTIYENPWVNLHVDKVRYTDGKVLDEYHSIEFPRGAVGSVIENERGQIVLVNLFRYPTGKYGWEIPGGVIEDGESVIEAAGREALEETGYTTRDHEHFYTYQPINGISNITFNITKCKAVADTGTYDTHEVTDVKWFTREEIMAMIKSRELSAGLTLIALMLFFNNI